MSSVSNPRTRLNEKRSSLLAENRSPSQFGVHDCVLWILILLAAVISIMQGIEVNQFVVLNGPTMLVVVCVLFTFIHGIHRYGWRHLLVFFAINVFFGMFYENLSIATGFPFGWYHYSDQLGPKFFKAPYILAIAYFQMLYLSWTIASIILDQYGARLRGAYRVALPCNCLVCDGHVGCGHRSKYVNYARALDLAQRGILLWRSVCKLRWMVPVCIQYVPVIRALCRKYQ